MNWVTLIWYMEASACLTLAVIYFLVWWNNRTAWANLLFAATAVSTAAFTLCELRQMRAATPEELLSAMRWTHVALLGVLVSTAWFVALYLNAGRRWLAWTFSGLRVFYLVVAFLVWGNVNFLDITSLRQMPFLGDSVTVFEGTRNSWMLFGYATMVVVLIFVADAGISAWRRGDRRRALTIAGSVEFFLLLGTVEAWLVHWAELPMPVVIGPFYLGLIGVMAAELSRDVLRASQLVRELQASEVSLRDLSRRLIRAHEEERHRIARELHDNVSQQTALLAMEIDQLAMRPEHPAAVLESLQQIGARTADVAREIHGLSHQLHSAKLETLGLQAAVEGHCRELRAKGLQVQCMADNVPRKLADDVALSLFRIVQEALNNVVKHSGANQAKVTLAGTDDGLVLTIADSGRGFDQAAGVGGVGLASMRERMHLIDGSIVLESQPGQGARIIARAPITAPSIAAARPSGMA